MEKKGVYLSPAKLVILLFGGVRPLARLLDKAQSSVSKWQNTDDGGVPRKCHLKLLQIAKERGVELTPDDLVFGRTLFKNEVAKKRSDVNLDPRIKI